jgi:hypothetical protein
MDERKIMEILTDWNFWGDFKEDLKVRSSYLSKLEGIFGRGAVAVLLGVRRAGKSSVAYLFIQGLIGRGLEPKNSLIVNFEDPRFPPEMSASDLMQIYELYIKKLDPSDHVVLLDEVQNVAGWERFVRYLLESKKVRALVTGSSSKLLGMEISTGLGGRHMDMEVFPLSFSEFLGFRGALPETEIDLVKQRLKVLRLLEEYMRWGGFPEVVLSESEARKRALLASYFSDIVVKDVAKRFGVREMEKLENLAGLSISNISTTHSLNRLKEAIGVSLDTVERFSEYLELARMFLSTRKFDYSKGRQLRSVRKVYAIDPGFFHVKGFRVSENYGRLAENIVAIELFRRASFNPPAEIYYWRDYQQREVDFVIKKGLKVTGLIQVCWDVGDPETKKREVRGLVKAMEEFKLREGLILTEDFEGEEEVDGRRIVYRPLWKWLLGG